MGVQPVVNAVHEADHLPRTFTHLRLLAVHGDPVGTAVVKPGQRHGQGHDQESDQPMVSLPVCR